MVVFGSPGAPGLAYLDSGVVIGKEESLLLRLVLVLIANSDVLSCFIGESVIEKRHVYTYQMCSNYNNKRCGSSNFLN